MEDHSRIRAGGLWLPVCSGEKVVVRGCTTISKKKNPVTSETWLFVRVAGDRPAKNFTKFHLPESDPSCRAP
jgi:hypothetical protein